MDLNRWAQLEDSWRASHCQKFHLKNFGFIVQPRSSGMKIHLAESSKSLLIDRLV